jgi:hypothetical protein
MHIHLALRPGTHRPYFITALGDMVQDTWA